MVSLAPSGSTNRPPTARDRGCTHRPTTANTPSHAKHRAPVAMQQNTCIPATMPEWRPQHLQAPYAPNMLPFALWPSSTGRFSTNVSLCRIRYATTSMLCANLCDNLGTARTRTARTSSPTRKPTIVRTRLARAMFLPKKCPFQNPDASFRTSPKRRRGEESVE
eukprot:COSAG02_NODE_6587_length_3475_cov_2.767476_1_plen_164_part_00